MAPNHVGESLFLEQIRECVLPLGNLPLLSFRRRWGEKDRPTYKGKAGSVKSSICPLRTDLVQRKMGEAGPHMPSYSSQTDQTENSACCFGAG